MGSDIDEIRWAPPVPKERVARLYRSDADGRLDEECLDDVGITLLLRCQSILMVGEAQRGRVHCPRCRRAGTESIIPRHHAGNDEVLRCPCCGWRVTWGAYHKTYRRKQLNEGGAGEAFRRFVRDYPAARTPQQKMLAIDRVIHEFHYSFRRAPDLPTRPTCVNLICGKLTDVIAFLDHLTRDRGEMAGAAPEGTHGQWRDKLRRCVVAPGESRDSSQ